MRDARIEGVVHVFHAERCFQKEQAASRCEKRQGGSAGLVGTGKKTSLLDKFMPCSGKQFSDSELGPDITPWRALGELQSHV